MMVAIVPSPRDTQSQLARSRTRKWGRRGVTRYLEHSLPQGTIRPATECTNPKRAYRPCRPSQDVFASEVAPHLRAGYINLLSREWLRAQIRADALRTPSAWLACRTHIWLERFCVIQDFALFLWWQRLHSLDNGFFDRHCQPP